MQLRVNIENGAGSGRGVLEMTSWYPAMRMKT